MESRCCPMPTHRRVGTGDPSGPSASSGDVIARLSPGTGPPGSLGNSSRRHCSSGRSLHWPNWSLKVLCSVGDWRGGRSLRRGGGGRGEM